MVEAAWHVELTDGTTTIELLAADPQGKRSSARYLERAPLERTSMKLGTGRTQYSDLVAPWYAITQDDFSGGRAGKNMLDDPSKYADAYGIQTWIPKRLTLGPQIHQDTSWNLTFSGTTTGAVNVALNAIGAPHAQTFTPPINMTVLAFHVYYQTSDGKDEALQGGLWSTSGGEPDAELAAGESKPIHGAGSGWLVITLDEPVKLTAATEYAIIISQNIFPTATVSILGQAASQYTGQAYESDGGGGWDPVTGCADFLLQLSTAASRVIFFSYRSLMHVAVSFGDIGGIISRRGTIGLASGGTWTTLVDSGETFSSGWIGRIIQIVAGTGVGQWGVVADASGTDTLTMEKAWDIVPDATSIYTSPGSWTTVQTTTVPITDVLVVDTVVYLASGAGSNMYRMQWTGAGGHAYAADGTNKAEYLALFRDADNEPCIWRSLGNEISNAGIQAWGTDLTFNTALRVGSSDNRITSITVYDDHLYIGTYSGLYALQEEIVRQVPVDFSALREIRNCQNMTTWNLYLIFPLLESLERLYGTQVDDFGPNIGEGLPSGRQGTISSILPLPGALIVAVDGGEDGISSVMLYNTLGWHEISRADMAGQRIQDLYYEAMPDSQIYLWWNEGGLMKYAWMSGRVFDRTRDSRADYTDTGYIITGWLGTDLANVTKIWNKATIYGTGTISVYYQLEDEDAAWNAASQASQDGNITVYSLSNITANRIRIKIVLTTSDEDSTPVVEALTVDALGRVRQANSYQGHMRLESMAISMHGQASTRDQETILAQLDEWAATTTPLTMTNALDPFDQKTVLLEPVQVRVEERNDLGTSYVLSIAMIEIDA